MSKPVDNPLMRKLHELLTAEMISQLENRGPDSEPIAAATLGAIAKFLKDNPFDFDTDDDDSNKLAALLQGVAKDLPEGEYA